MDTVTPCPNHAGAYDCTPFCELCEGNQETTNREETQMKSLFIDTYKWHDKTYGNSYFSSQVSINGALAFSIPFSYGHERMDEYAVMTELVKRGILENNMTALRPALELMGCDYYRATQWALKSETTRHGELMPFMVGKGF